MDEKLTFTGGEPDINFDDLDRNNKANRKALTEALRAYGDNYKIAGVISAAAPSSVTAGYVMLDGEILQVDAHTATGNYFEKVTTFDPAGDKTFNDTTPRQTWAKHRATQTSAGITNLGYSSPRFGDVIATLLRATASAFATTVLAGIVEKALAAEVLSGAADKYIDAALLQSHGAWQTPSYTAAHSDYTVGDYSGLRYRKLTNGMIQIRGSYTRSSVSTGVVFTLPVGYRPSQTLSITGNQNGTALQIPGTINSSGVVSLYLGSTLNYMTVNAIIPQD